MVVNIQEKLISLGLSSYEAKIYTALYEDHPATAYEIAKRGGIPTSKVYENLNKLKSKGIVFEGYQEEKTLYTPLEIEVFISNCRRQLEESLQGLDNGFKKLEKGSKGDFLWNLTNREEFIQRAGQMIGGAEHSIILSGWKEEIDTLLLVLSNRVKERIKTATVLFGSQKLETIGPVFHHPIEDTLYEERGGRALVLVTDSQTALWGTFTDQGLQGAAYSQNPGFVTLAEDYIKHDIYMMKIVERFDSELKIRFGENYSLLRDIFSDKELL